MPKPLRVRYAKIQRLVHELLRKHNIRRPPIDIERVARGERMHIFTKRLQDDFSGLLLKERDEFIIGVNGRHPETRRRFTIAHELGHALLHHFDDVHVDRNFKLRSPLSAQAVDVEEIEANTFAAWILMPAEMVIRDLERTGLDMEDDEAIGALAKRYAVSRQSMTFRVLNLQPSSGASDE